jgi:hypothetical protein
MIMADADARPTLEKNAQKQALVRVSIYHSQNR